MLRSIVRLESSSCAMYRFPHEAVAEKYGKNQPIWFNIPICLKRIQTQSLETSICGGFAVDLPKHPITSMQRVNLTVSQSIFREKCCDISCYFYEKPANWGEIGKLVFSRCHVYANDGNLVTVWTAYSNLTYWFLRRFWIDQSLMISPSRWKW